MEEIKKCTRCGIEKPLSEIEKNGKGSWCKECKREACREWRRKNGANEKTRVTWEQKKEWREHVAQTGSITKSAEHFGVNPCTMQRYVSDVLKAFKAARNQRILELRAQKLSMEEIAKELGITDGVVSTICRQNGIGGQVRHGGGFAKISEEKRAIRKCYEIERGESLYKSMVESLGLEYVEGYSGSRGFVNVKCRTCGDIFPYSCVAIRHNYHDGITPVCRKCEDIKRAAAKAEADKAKAEQRAKRQAQQQKKAKEAEAAKEAKRHRVCKECGAEFISSSGVYCSEECRRRNNNRRKSAKRRGYKQKIPLTKLYSRDKGICYICGCSCDFDDYEMIDGAFVVGPSYPTVEHVIPLCRGGDDSWENVKLACHKCNSAKSTKSLYQVKSSGQIAWVI